MRLLNVWLQRVLVEEHALNREELGEALLAYLYLGGLIMHSLNAYRNKE